MSNASPPASNLSPALLAALASTAKHVEAEALLEPATLPSNVRINASRGNFHSKKTIRGRKRNKLAAQSRKRNRK